MSDESSGSTDRSLPKRTIYRLLAHPHRRNLVGCLLTHREPLPLADLADEVAVREADAPLPEVPAEDVRDVYMMLYHNHVPRLENHGLVRYDQDRDMVALTERANELEPFFESGGEASVK